MIVEKTRTECKFSRNGRDGLEGDSYVVRSSALWLASVILLGSSVGSVLAQNLDPAIPTIELVLGHPAGQRAVRYDEMVEYFQRLDHASPRVTMTPYAQSHEGRTLYYLTITSEANHARLPELQVSNAKLADPRKLKSDDEANTLLDSLPAVAWLAYNIHGDELSSTDAAMQVAYQLTAGTDEATKKLRDELIIHVDPLMNPDGRERYLVQLQNLTGKVPNLDYQSMQHGGLWSAGRGNHYLFDLNRDWLMQVHPETRGRSAAMLDWNPHLVVDSHEMGGLDTYLFDPPREPFNVHLSEQNLSWRRRFSADQAKAMDQYGWSYYTQEWYEEWYPGYTNAWANLLGAIGILYEQAAVNSAALKQEAGTVLSYAEAVQHHVVSSMANLESLRVNRRAVLSDFLTDRRWSVSSEGPHNEIFLLPPPADRSRFDRFIEVLDRQGIERHLAGTAFTAQKVTDIWGQAVETREFPAGTLIVRSAQPHRRLLHAILCFDPHMSDTFLLEERRELENHRESRIYDVTGWSLPMAYGLTAYWAGSVAEVASESLASPAVIPPLVQSGYGYLIDGADADIQRALVMLLGEECKPRIATKPFRAGGQDYKAGTVLLRVHENPEGFREVLQRITTELKLVIRPVDTALSEKGSDLGGPRFRLLQPPRVAIATQWPISTTSFGSTWYLLDARLGLATSPVNIQSIGQTDLRRYNVIVLPDCWDSDKLAAVLGKGTVESIHAWVEAGGTLIALGGSADFLANKDLGLSEVRLRQDVLDQLPVYAEAVEREKNARAVEVDSAEVWSRPSSKTDATASVSTSAPSTAPADTQSAGKDAEPEANVEKLKRLDEWQRLFSPSGVIVAAVGDPEHWLTFGLDARVPVLIGGSSALMSKHPAATPVRLGAGPELRLSGLLWPEARQRWADTAYATVESVGNGQVILFAGDPFFRGYFEGSGRLLANAIVLGPGLGASHPVPW